MFRIRNLALACTLFSGLTAPALAQTAGGSTAESSDPAVVSIAPRQGIALHRTVFIDGGGVPHDTATGVLEIDPAHLARATGLDRGFIHLATDRGAVSYNIPFDGRPGANVPPAMLRMDVAGDDQVPVTQVPFPLSSAEPIGTIAVQIGVTAEPLRDSAALKRALKKVRLNTFVVTALPEAIGGDGPGDMLDYAGPGVGPLPPPKPQGDYEQGGFQPDYIYSQPHLENVETAWNQCAPAGYANGLAYLEAAFPWFIDFPQDHVPGVAIDGDEDSLVSRMDWYMDRPHTDTCNGSGTMRCNTFGDSNPSSSMRGLFEFLNIWDDEQKVALRHQGGGDTYPCGLDQPLDRESHREGEEVTFDWLCDRVQDGSAIILTVGYYDWVGYGAFTGASDIPWDRTGGHVVRVFGCGEVNGQRFLRTLDDGQQDRMEDTDADDEPDTCQPRDGLRTQHWWVLEDTIQGRLQLGGSGRQVDFAMAMTADL